MNDQAVEVAPRYRLVPVNPEPARIESMALRHDHSHGLPMPAFGPGGAFDLEDAEQFERRRESNRRTARQLYEEAIGEGFYRSGVEPRDLEPHEVVAVFKRVSAQPILEIVHGFEITFGLACIAEWKKVNGL